MRNPFLRPGVRLAVCIACAIAAALASASPATSRPVADWLRLADRQLALGKPGRALILFGEVAARHPGLAPAQDGLRRSFSAIGPIQRSERFLRFALAEDPAREQALLAAWQALDRLHPLRISVSASLLPSSNIEHVASERYLVTGLGTFVIDDGGNEKSGVGLGYRTSLDWVLHPRPGGRFVIGASYGGAWFRTARLRFGEPALSLRYEHLAGRAPWSVEAFVSRRRYHGSAGDITDDNTARGLAIRKVWRPARGGRLALRLGTTYRSYSRKPYLTGPTYEIGLERRRRIGAAGAIAIALRAERGRPRTSYHRYWGGDLRLTYARPVLDGLRVAVSLGLGQRLYDTRFPIVGMRRRDSFASVGLRVQLNKVRIFGRAPDLGCTARRTRSNIALYTTSAIDCAFGLSLDF